MKRLLIAFAVAVLATLALGAATAKAANGWTLTINVDPTTVAVDGQIDVYGQLTNPGGQGFEGADVTISWFGGHGCTGESKDFTTTTEKGWDGWYGESFTSSEPGDYSVMSTVPDREASSECVDVTVTETATAKTEPRSETGVFLCYSKWQVEPGVWPYGTAMALLKGGGYWLPYAVPGNPDYSTNLGKYHLVCNLAATQSVSTNVMHSGGEVWSSDDAKVIFGDAVGPLYPVVSGG